MVGKDCCERLHGRVVLLILVAAGFHCRYFCWSSCRSSCCFLRSRDQWFARCAWFIRGIRCHRSCRFLCCRFRLEAVPLRHIPVAAPISQPPLPVPFAQLLTPADVLVDFDARRWSVGAAPAHDAAAAHPCLPATGNQPSWLLEQEEVIAGEKGKLEKR